MDQRLLDAARSGNVDLLKTIAEEDADLLLGATPFGNTALHIAIRFKRQNFVEEICKRKPVLLGERNVNDETPLHAAAIIGSHRTVLIFIGYAAALDVERGGGRALVRAVDQNCNNALHAALLNGHAEVAQELVSADPGLGASINKQEESPLYLAARRGFLQTVQLLLRYDQSDHRGPRKQTALHAAVIEGHREIAHELLEKRIEIGKEKDDEGKTPLHHAVTWGNLTMVRLLLQHDSSVVYVADRHERSPVHLCAREGNVAVFRELFGSCPDAFDAVDAEGRNALHIAIEHVNKLTVRYLLTTPGLDRLLNQRDKEGKTPLHIAVKQHHPHVLKRLLRSKRLDTCVTDQQGLTAAQSFYTDRAPHLCPSWYATDTRLRRAWAKHDATKLNFLRKYVLRMEKKWLTETRDSYSRNLSVVAVFIATVTFAAGFTIPGGYVSDDGPEQGRAVLSKKAAIKAFLVFDTVSMCCSLSAAYLYSTSAVKHVTNQQFCAYLGKKLVELGVLSMLIAFAAGIYAVVAPHCLWLGILIFCLCSSLIFLLTNIGNIGL